MLYGIEVRINMEDVLVKCEKLDHFGRGLGHVLGKIIFVPNLLPSEEALVKIVLDKKKYMIGEVIQLVKRSNDRIEPKCLYENCGCGLKNLDYFKTLKFKKSKVIEILKRYSNLEGVVKEIVSSDDIYGYRNKITLKVKNGKIGYFKNGTNELIEISRCAIASKKSNEIISILKKSDLSEVKEVIIKDFGELMVIVKGNMNVDLLKPLASSIYINDNLVYGKENIIAKLGEFKFYVSKDSFFQVNMNVAFKLYNKVLEYLKNSNSKRVLDLYCGTGTISLFLSKYFDEVIGTEINEEAICCANLNKELNNIVNVRFICGDVSEEIHYLKADNIVVDPPRSGLTNEGINDILKIGPDRIVYVSCDPMTLARDLKLFKGKYEVKEVTLFDMFPWTYHVESVCLLIRK